MTQEHLTKEAVLATIKKLLNVKTERGATEGEELNAISLAQKLLAKHELTMLDVEEAKLDNTSSQFKCVDDTFVSFYTNPPAWVAILAAEICRGLDCEFVLGQTYVQGKGVKGLYHFVGLEVDAAISKYLYLKLADELYDGARVQAKRRQIPSAQIRRYSNSYIINAARVIGMRLRQNREELKRTEQKYGALVVLKGSILKDYLSEQFPDLKTRQFEYSGHSAGGEDGRQAGREADLNVNKISGSAKPQQAQLGG